MIVVDASAAVKWVAAEPDHELALPLLKRDDLIAPYLLLVEVANALSRKINASEVSLEQAATGLDRIGQLVRLVVPDQTLLNRALDLAVSLKHPIYDCLYLALAISEASPLVTFDQEFAKLAASRDLQRHFARLPLEATQ